MIEMHSLVITDRNKISKRYVQEIKCCRPLAQYCAWHPVDPGMGRLWSQKGNCVFNIPFVSSPAPTTVAILRRSAPLRSFAYALAGPSGTSLRNPLPKCPTRSSCTLKSKLTPSQVEINLSKHRLPFFHWPHVIFVTKPVTIISSTVSAL